MSDIPATPADAQAATPDFVLGLLADLRAQHYRPAAWGAFLARSWRHSRATARAHPELVASWRRVTGGLALAELATLALEARLGHTADVRRAWPGATLCLALQQADVYVHLGMNAPQRGAALSPALGIPTALTLARQAIAGLLWGHLLAGRPVARAYATSALFAASVTDIADGVLARRQKRTSFLGQYLDAEADFSAALALTVTLGARRAIPRWLLALLLVRWCAPLLYALARYIGAGRRVPFASRGLGKLAGVAQSLALGVALLPPPPPQVRRRMGAWPRRGRRALHLVTAGLLVIAPLIHLRHLRQ